MLAIDPGESTGVAWTDGDGIAFATWFLGDDQRRRLARLADRLVGLAAAGIDCRIIGYEAPFVGRFASSCRPLYHYEAIILAWSLTIGATIHAYSPKEIKRAIRVGPGVKEGVMRGVVAAGYAPANQHEADAIALLLLMRTGTLPARAEAAYLRRTAQSAPDLFMRPRTPRLRGAAKR